MISYPYPTIKDPAGAGSFNPASSRSCFSGRCAQASLCAVALPFLAGLGLLLRFHLSHHLADEIILLLFDPGADFVTLELHHRGAGLLQELLDRDVRVLDEGLPYQGDFRQI